MLQAIDKPINQHKLRLGRLVPKRLKAHPDLLLALGVAVVLVVVGLLLGRENERVVTPSPYPGYHYTAEPHNPLSFFANWDGADYPNLARSGYSNIGQTNLFPGYPLLIRAVHEVIPSYLDSALLISWVSLVGAVYFFIKVARRVFAITDRLEPLRAVLFFVLFPTGVFLLAPFTESLYAFMALGAIYFALQKKPLWAALLAMACTATHITGMFVVVLVAGILFEQKERLRNIAATVIVGSAGLLGYMAFLFARFDQPLAFVGAQEGHGWLEAGFVTLLKSLNSFNLLFIGLLIVSAVYWWRRRKSFAIYSILLAAIPFAGKQVGGFDRYVLMAFPMQLMLYGYFRERRWLYPYVATLLGIIWTYFLLQYAGGYRGS